VDTSETTAAAKLIMARRLAHTSTALAPCLPLCSHLTDRDGAALELTRSRYAPWLERSAGRRELAAGTATGDERRMEMNAMR
jgi:hypothetical protein